MASYLERLLGQRLKITETGNSTTYAIGKAQDDPGFQITEMELTLIFEAYNLNIYNPITIIPSHGKLSDFVGLTITEVGETTNEARLVFDIGRVITIDLREEAYSGPEAMCLTGPDNFTVVWS